MWWNCKFEPNAEFVIYSIDIEHCGTTYTVTPTFYLPFNATIVPSRSITLSQQGCSRTGACWRIYIVGVQPEDCD
jgi:hypothetical protein